MKLKKTKNEKGKEIMPFRNFGVKNLIWLYLFSLLISCCLFSFIDPAVDSFFQKRMLTITLKDAVAESSGNEIWLYKINGKDISQEQYDEISKTGSWEYIPVNGGRITVGNNTIYSNVPGSSLSIPISYSTDGGVTIWCQAYSGQIDVTNDSGDTQSYNLYSKDGGYLQITPYPDKYSSVFIRVIAYLIVALGIFFVLLAVILLIKRYAAKEHSQARYKYWQVVTGMAVVIFIFDCVWYKVIGIPNFPGFGDGSGYWDWGGVLAKVGVTKQEIDSLCLSLPTFRGYGIFIPHFLAQFIGVRLGISSFGVYFAIMSLACAFLFGYVLPRTYELLRGEKLHVWQIVLGAVGFYTFYTNALCGLGSDMCGLIYYFSGILFGLLVIQTGEKRFAFLSGLFFSLCLAARTSYLIGVGVIAAAVLVHIVLMYLKRNKINIVEWNIGSIKKFCTLATIFAITFLFVCTPQMYINHLKGHPGLFAYDSDGAYGTKTTNLLEQSADVSLRGYLTGYPESLYDPQVAFIKTDGGYLPDKEITMAQSMDAYAKRPLDAFVSMAKRLFALIDIKSNIDLPPEGWSATTKCYLFSTINYIYLITAMYLLMNRDIRKKLYSKKDLTLWGILLAGPVLPLLAGKIEWRGGMTLYVFYIVWSCWYCLGNVIYDKEKRELVVNSNYLIFLTVGVFLCHAVTLTMHMR